MSNDVERLEVLKAYRDGNVRFTYFLLAAAGAAIGLAVQQTQTVSIAWAQLPLGIAVLLWGASFFYGCRQVDETLLSFRINYELFEIMRGVHDLAGRDPKRQAIGISTGREAFELVARRAARFARWQFHLLIADCVLYLVWHLLRMYLRIA